MINLEQIRAHHAFAKAAAIAPNDRKDYLTLARNLPAMFQNNGLLASWAFLLSKGENSHRLALQVLLDHFRDPNFGLVAGGEQSTPQSVFVERWTNSTADMSGIELMKLTAEAVAFSGWLKRAAEALCDQ